jgi:hypothetical protein
VRLAALALVVVLSGGCALGSPPWWNDAGAPNQLVLGSADQGCTATPDLAGGDPCLAHDMSYSIGGREQDRFTADAELLAALALHGVPEPVAMLYYCGVRLFGWTRWPYAQQRTRGPPR